jgi:hypothetical protein
MLSGVLQVTEAAPATDALGKAWETRAEQARRTLGKPGLDACDKGLEKAFESVKELPGKDGVHAYPLNIEVAGQTMRATYYYNGAQLTDFMLVSLPDSWLAVQKPGSKTLSILVTNSNCALDLCTDDPFTGGKCPQRRP